MSKQKPAASDTRRAQLRAAQIQQAKKDKNKRIAVLAVSAVVVIALVAAVVLLVNRGRDAQVAATPPNATADRDAIITHPETQPREGAPVVSLFLDYQCPACARFEQQHGPTLDELASSGEIQLEYRTMTFLDANLRNDSSTRAANAAACADLTGRYFEYHNTIFSQAPAQEGSGYTDESLIRDFTAQAGITGDALETFDTCYAQKRFSGFVNNVDQEAGQAGITGTPTLQVNGETLNLENITQAPDSLRDEIMKLV